MNRLCVALVSAPLFFGCGKALESLDTKVADSPPVQTTHLDTRTADYFPSAQTAQTPAQTEDQESPCSSPPDIHHLFEAYNNLKAEVDKKHAAPFGAVIERTYVMAEEEMKNARNTLAICNKERDEYLYLLANFFAVSALKEMMETRIRVYEHVCTEIPGVF